MGVSLYQISTLCLLHGLALMSPPPEVSLDYPQNALSLNFMPSPHTSCTICLVLKICYTLAFSIYLFYMSSFSHLDYVIAPSPSLISKPNLATDTFWYEKIKWSRHWLSITTNRIWTSHHSLNQCPFGLWYSSRRLLTPSRSWSQVWTIFLSYDFQTNVGLCSWLH